jgi:hypothetical protein
MQATTKQVKAIVETLADMTGDGVYRRYWSDRTKDKASTKRYMAFRFWGAWEADAVARRLEVALAHGGYTNKVTRTSVDSDWATHRTGGEYVRVVAVAE